MPYTTKYDKAGGIFFIEHTGRVDVEEIRNVQKKIFEVFSGEGIDKFFVDTTEVTHMPSVVEQFEIGNNLVQKTRGGIKAAICASEEFETQLRFFENVIRNRGGNIKIFRSKEKAKAWLKD